MLRVTGRKKKIKDKKKTNLPIKQLFAKYGITKLSNILLTAIIFSAHIKKKN